ncbi:methyltransferase [Fusarium globosum]|uniref:Methyltransferase n=1 Tax=Fusarium globosum TaxID=78864 RepID=A0A8H6D3L6_9HYPO|nr:methyltransferase [Fusarium globosum]
MNSPPNSFSRQSGDSPSSKTPNPKDGAGKDQHLVSRHMVPPSPASSTTSPLAVGSAHEAALIQSIERGDYATDDDETRSLTDSIRQHIVEGGLRYHSYHAGKYLFPNDEAEQDREELKHNLTVYLCDDRLFFAPIEQLLEAGAECLDLGTGIGKWCIDLADMYPNSQFHGMDLSPIQPDWVPENAMFVVDDIEHEAGWTYGDETFDYIHIRHTVHSIQDRELLWERIWKHLKPGGYVEVQEFNYIAACDDDSCDGPYAWRDYCKYLHQGMLALGTDLHGITHVGHELHEAGFENITTKAYKCPLGPWAKKKRLQECGHVLRDVVMLSLHGISRKPLRDGLGWTALQIEMFLIEVRKSLTQEVNGLPKFHTYFPYLNIHARKPLNSQRPIREDA